MSDFLGRFKRGRQPQAGGAPSARGPLFLKAILARLFRAKSLARNQLLRLQNLVVQA